MCEAPTNSYVHIDHRRAYLALIKHNTKVNMNNLASLSMDKNVASMPISNPKDMANNTAHCDRACVPSLCCVPKFHRMPEPLNEKETKARRVVVTNFIERFPFLAYFCVLDVFATCTLVPLAGIVSGMRSKLTLSFGAPICYVLAKWHSVLYPLNYLKENIVLEGNEFSSCAREICLRNLCYRARNKDEELHLISRYLVSHIWCLAHHQNLQISNAALRRLNTLICLPELQLEPKTAELLTLRLRLREASILEKKGEFRDAVRQATQIARRLQASNANLDVEEEKVLADSLLSCGQWMAKHKILPASSILTDYLRQGAHLAERLHRQQPGPRSARRAKSSFLSVGQLVSSLFEMTSGRVKSLEWQQSGRNLAERKRELTRLEKTLADVKAQFHRSKKGTKDHAEIQSRFRELMIYHQTVSRETRNSEVERTKIHKSLSTHLRLALRSLASALSIEDKGFEESMSATVYRFVSLWFAADEGVGWDTSIDDVIVDAIRKIPPFRFVPLSSQLFARVENHEEGSSETFQNRLHELILKMCISHPYHCLVHLIALSNGNKVGVVSSSSRTSNGAPDGSTAPKVQAARHLIKRLQAAGSDFVPELIESYRMIADAYYFLAMAPTTEFHRGNTKKIQFSAVCKTSSSRLDQCLGLGKRMVRYPPCILTQPPPIRPRGDYGEGKEDPIGGERIATFEGHFAITDGGLHRPKIVMCLGSRGGRFRQLVKGEDEIRQDSVMEQVFGFVNELMRHRKAGDKAGRMQTSRLVTYHIVPISPKSGVIEWVEHTMPFGEYITDRGSKRQGQLGAHSRYYPGEWNQSACREYIKNAKVGKKREAFDEICDNHSPCFRFFFVERFGHSMELWHAAKTRYTRSVAVSSIVGHILGIGDRHTSNILVHRQTGEVVHIDFGIVFDQGKTLNTPERVPFRLTRNIVDGMGPLGIEGTFIAAAERTLAVLKENSNALLTILSAIVSDPLYRWSVSDVKARTRQRQKDDDDDGISFSLSSTADFSGRDGADTNKAAEQAVARIHEKLQGYEEGTSGEQQSMEAQIQLLVNSARDHDNLAEMFPGWAPWV